MLNRFIFCSVFRCFRGSQHTEKYPSRYKFHVHGFVPCASICVCVCMLWLRHERARAFATLLNRHFNLYVWFVYYNHSFIRIAIVLVCLCLKISFRCCLTRYTVLRTPSVFPIFRDDSPSFLFLSYSLRIRISYEFVQSANLQRKTEIIELYFIFSVCRAQL